MKTILRTQFKTFLLVFLMGFGIDAFSQLSLPAGTSYVENFNGIGSGLPTGWTARTDATNSNRGNGVTFATATNSWGDTGGAFKNLAASDGLASGSSVAVQAASSNRAFGVRQSGSFGDPGAAFELELANTIGRTAFNLQIRHEMLSVQTRSTTWSVQYSINSGSSWSTIGTYTDPGTFGSTLANYTFGTALDDLSTQVLIRVVALSSSTGTGSRDTYAIDDFVLSWASASTPVIIISDTFLPSFGSINVGNSSSIESFEVDASSLTNNVTATASSGYEVSLNNLDFFSSVELTQSGGSLIGQPVEVFVRFSPTAGGENNGTITLSSDGALNQVVTVNGTGVVVLPEPSNHAAAFTATATGFSSIDLSWTDATGATLPEGYLILANETGSFTAPVDGVETTEDTDLSDGSAAVYVAFGEEAYTFSGLNGETTYYFTLYPFTNSGSNIDFKTDGAIPQANATTDEEPEICGSESFDNENFANLNSYNSGSFVGDNGVVWTYGEASKSDIYSITGPGILLRRASDSFLETTLNGGVGTFSFQYRKAFTGGADRQLEILVNNVQIGTTPVFGNSTGDDPTVYNFSVEIDAIAPVTIRIKNVGSTTTNRHIVIDNIVWTCVDAETATFGTVAQQAPVCAGQPATILLTGLIPDSTSSVTFTIGGGSPITLTDIISDENGDASFSINLGLASNGQTLTITEVVRTDEASLPFTPSENNTVVLEVTAAPIWYADVDGDGFGDDTDTLSACDQPVGYVATGGDCNDNDATIYPGAPVVCYDGIDQNCDGDDTDGCPQITTQLLAADCNSSLTSMTQTVRAGLVSIPSGVSVNAYRFRVTNLLTSEEREVTTSNRVFAMSLTDIAEYDTTYSVEVALLLNAEWQPYGPACNLTTPGLPTTTLASSSCNAVLASMTSLIRANTVTSAINYEFEVSLIEGGVPVGITTIIRPNASFNITQLSGIDIKFGAEYRVRVRTLLPSSSGEQTSAYGAECSVFTPDAFESFVEGCSAENGLTPATLNSAIYTRPTAGLVTQYKFRLVNESLSYDVEITSTFRTFRLNDFNAVSPLQAGATYTATVEYEMYGFFYSGKDCLITVPGGARMVNPATDVPEVVDIFDGFKALASPNPFSEGFTINVYTNSTQPVGVAIYDMTGRLLETKQVNADNLNTQSFGQNYPAGVYNIVVTQEDETKIVRVIKK
ncbi:MAG: T9SS type A sorting domain-containing protein [Flavobacterium sp.]